MIKEWSLNKIYQPDGARLSIFKKKKSDFKKAGFSICEKELSDFKSENLLF